MRWSVIPGAMFRAANDYAAARGMGAYPVFETVSQYDALKEEASVRGDHLAKIHCGLEWRDIPKAEPLTIRPTSKIILSWFPRTQRLVPSVQNPPYTAGSVGRIFIRRITAEASSIGERFLFRIGSGVTSDGSARFSLRHLDYGRRPPASAGRLSFSLHRRPAPILPLHALGGTLADHMLFPRSFSPRI